MDHVFLLKLTMSVTMFCHLFQFFCLTLSRSFKLLWPLVGQETEIFVQKDGPESQLECLLNPLLLANQGTCSACPTWWKGGPKSLTTKWVHVEFLRQKSGTGMEMKLSSRMSPSQQNCPSFFVSLLELVCLFQETGHTATTWWKLKTVRHWFWHGHQWHGRTSGT